MTFSNTRKIFFESHVENPVESVFDLPMGAHGLGSLFGSQCSRGDIVTTLPGAVRLVFDARFDPDDGGDPGKAILAGEAPVSGHPVNDM